MSTEVRFDVCPKCGSIEVRWRARRFYDVILTWIEASLVTSALYPDCHGAWPFAYGLPDDGPPPKPNYETPKRFWRCVDCAASWTEFEKQAEASEASAPVVEQILDEWLLSSTREAALY